MRLWTLDSRLSVVGLRKSFVTPAGEKLEILRGVSLSVGGGEMVAVVGASGAGKSTLLHVVGGLEAADDGDVRLDGLDVLRASGAELARLRNHEIGFVFQFHHLLFDLTAEENVALPLVIARQSFAEARARATEVLGSVGLKERAAHGVGELSGGEQQRVAIARALANRPRLLLADEPTGNLDARTGEEIGTLLFSLCRARRLSAIVATHNENLARMCDRVLRLQNGRLDEARAGSQRTGVN
ncbi:MAG: ABC transporter ATP-binding protein [Pyrinomonadaceae bacterium]